MFGDICERFFRAQQKKNPNSFVLQADSGAKIRLLICECFFMPDSDFIMLVVGLASVNWLETEAEQQRTLPQLPLSLPDSPPNSINSPTDFLLPSIDMQKSEIPSNPLTFNLFASLFIRELVSCRFFFGE
jgi:hypothetical protein